MSLLQIRRTIAEAVTGAEAVAVAAAVAAAAMVLVLALSATLLLRRLQCGRCPIRAFSPRRT